MEILGADIVIESLKNEGVEVVFGYPGGAVLPLYDALYRTDFPHILARHEQGAIHAADGYARATGKVGVCIATSGPGATNLITGIATAYMDSVPLVAITGQVGVSLIGKDSFQEADVRGITTPITKHNYLVKKIADLPRVLKEAFFIARSGRPGPVVIDISKDVFNATLAYEYPEDVKLRGYSPIFAGDDLVIEQVVEKMRKAKNPLLFVGGGVNISDTSDMLRKIVEWTGFPVISSLMGLGCMPGDHARHLGMVGMHGTYAANMATTECDLLLGIGVRFDDRVTGSVKDFAPLAEVVHFDIDPAEINKNIIADVRVIGDLQWSLPLLYEKAQRHDFKEWHEQINVWSETVRGWKQENPLAYQCNPDVIMPQSVIETVSQLTKGDAIIVTDVGQHQMWAAQYYNFINQRSFLTSGGLGTMGYGLPAAIGAQLGLPEKKVILFTGDGSIMMNCQEMATAANNNIPVKIIVMNNQVLGMVNQWQRMFYEERYSHTCLKGHTDFVKLAEAMGVTGLRVTHSKELSEIIEQALRIEGPVLVDICLPCSEDVLPMVPANCRLDQMVLGG
ncbi:biosynthetic-type acetolactate synthase large subunit [Pelosinus sp. sgz500959]|uniref:biosynthetic-type acetolactate synthase large subunit n=1 Tax=Pelosinus sp. sgz500959 TaxID=3242472 RepID=UPI00366F7750